MSLQQNIGKLYDNILSAKMWAALPNALKQQLIRDPAAINDMLDDPKKIAQQAAVNNRQIQLSEEQEKTILNTPPCPFNAISLKKFFLQHVPNGEEAFKEIRKQTLAETERYLTKELTPMLTMEQIYETLEHPEAHYALEGVQPHGQDPLPRYSSSERKQRRAVSAAVRKAHIQLADWSENTLPELPSLPRAYGVLYIPEYADTRYVTYKGTLKERNEEIGWLFNPNSEKYQKEKNDLVVKLGPHYGDGSLATRAQAVEEQFAKRRGEMVMERLKAFQEFYNNLDTITDPSLPAAELAKNFLRIERASNMVPDITTYLAAVNSGFLAVSEEDKAMMEAFRPNSVCSALLSAKAKLHLIANPMYEYLDINTMNGYNMPEIYSVYRSSDYDVYEPGWRKGKTDLKPEFKNYAAGIDDNCTVMLGDIVNQIGQQKLAMANKQDILERFSFDDQSTAHFQENYADEVKNPDRPDEKVAKYPDKPHAYQQGDRVVIIQQKTPTDTLSIMHPEEMYNQSLRGNNALHLRTLLATDPWYMINHGEFRELKSALRKVDDLPPLKANFTQQDIDKAIRRFQRLEQASTAYMERKERDRLGRTDKKLKERETARVEETKKIHAYAKFKLKELQLVRDAKATLDKYQGKSLAEIKTLTAEENKSALMKAQIRKKDIEDRMANPGAWLKQLYSNAKLPPKLRSYLDNNVAALKVNYKFNNWLNQEAVKDKLGLVQTVAGSAVAAQLVVQEQRERKAAGINPAVKGPIEMYLSDAKRAKDWIDKLGTAAMNQHILEHAGEIPRKMDGEYSTVHLINSFLNHFDPRDKLNVYRDLIQPSVMVYPTELKYVGAIEPIRENDKNCSKFREFTQNSIIEPARQCAVPNRKVSQQALDTLLGNTLVYGMIQEDRLNPPEKGGASMEPLLSSSYRMEQLRTWVVQSDVYQAVRNSCLDDAGKLSSQKVLDTVQNGIPEETIQNCKASYKESFAAWYAEWHKENAPAIRAELQNQVAQVEQNNRKKLKLEDAQPGAAAKEAPIPKETIQNGKASLEENFAAWKKENAAAVRAKLKKQVEQIPQNNRKKLKLEDAQPKAAGKEAPIRKGPQLPKLPKLP